MDHDNVIDLISREFRDAAQEVAKASPAELADIAIECLNAMANKFPEIASISADGSVSMDPAFAIGKACMLRLRNLLEQGQA